jgi:hypothetical protein
MREERRVEQNWERKVALLELIILYHLFLSVLLPLCVCIHLPLNHSDCLSVYHSSYQFDSFTYRGDYFIFSGLLQ